MNDGNNSLNILPCDTIIQLLRYLTARTDISDFMCILYSVAMPTNTVTVHTVQDY